MNLGKKESLQSHLLDIIINKLLSKMKMDFSIRINRLSAILELLNKGYDYPTYDIFDHGKLDEIVQKIYKEIESYMNIIIKELK